MRRSAFFLGLAVLLAVTDVMAAQMVPVTLHLPAGYNAISNPVNATNNAVAALLPAVPNGTIFYKIDSGTGGYSVNHFDSDQGGWESPGGAAGELKPGEGAWLYLPQPTTVSWSGVVPVPQARLDLNFSSYNFIGCVGTQPCSFAELTGFAPRPGDVAYLFNQPVITPPNGTNFSNEASSIHHYGTNRWDIVPTFFPGRGAFVYLASEPRVSINPLRLRLPQGSAAVFNVVILGGVAPTSLQWRFQGTPIQGQNGNSLIITNVSPATEGYYSVDAVFGSALVSSPQARLLVVLPPVVQQPPVPTTVVLGKPAKFSVRASGTPPLYYQWLQNGAAVTPFIENQTNYFIPAVTLSDGGDYSVAVSNFAATIFSPATPLEILFPPEILVQPTSQTVPVGQTVTLVVQADGTQPLLYQWKLNGNPISGATNSTFTIADAKPDDSGSYRVTVANVAGAVDSIPALIEVSAPFFNFSDNFFGGPIVSSTSEQVRGLNVGATPQTGEPNIFDKRGGRSVWMIYRAPASGIVTFSTKGSTFDTLLGAYQGTSLQTLVEVAGDEDGAGFLTSKISFNVVQNEIYHIVIDGLGGQNGKILLRWDLEVTPERIPQIIQQPRSQTVPLGSSAQFNVIAAGSGTPPLTYQWFYNGTPINGATQPMLTVPVAGSNVLGRVGFYFVRVRQVSASGSRFVDSRPAVLEVNSVDQTGRTENVRTYDKFEDMIYAQETNAPAGGGGFTPAAGVVLGYTGSQVFSTVGSGLQDGEPLHCGAIGGASRWFAYVPPANGEMYINTDGSSFDTLLAAYRGCCDFEDLTLVGCDNNSGTNGLTSSLHFPATNGVPHYFAVDGVNGIRGSVKLNYRLLIPMTLTNVSKTSTSLTFKVTVTPSYPFTVQGTTNMLSWTNLFTTNTSSGIYTYKDTNFPPTSRSYRTMQVP